MQGLVQAMQTQAHTQAALQAQLEAQQAQVPTQDHGGPSIMERFKRMLPPSFKGESDPLLERKEDGTLTSMVKGTQIRVTQALLASLFDVTTFGHSGVHTMDIQAKDLGIVGPEYRLKDGKLDINQLNVFNRLLHFIVCQIVVPRSATFSTCTKADSDLIFWAIQN
ncbi:hypothetical protein Taro_050958 [Colocasia esculenta]|uniref:Uncharacterized protein n=1 Tax=Colocasia esculenta TaxID=4460 RepID=A0A843XEQ6_COLES|nr:hypothetical protein [Colocasia esculenta]